MSLELFVSIGYFVGIDFIAERHSVLGFSVIRDIVRVFVVAAAKQRSREILHLLAKSNNSAFKFLAFNLYSALSQSAVSPRTSRSMRVDVFGFVRKSNLTLVAQGLRCEFGGSDSVLVVGALHFIVKELFLCRDDKGVLQVCRSDAAVQSCAQSFLYVSIYTVEVVLTGVGIK